MQSFIQLRTSDGVVFDFESTWVAKCEKIAEFFEESRFVGEPIDLDDINSEALTTIIEWLRTHALEAPRSTEERHIHRFNRYVAVEDTQLLDRCFPRAKLAAVINGAYSLGMNDLIATLVKYMANNLEGKTAEQMSMWLEIPLKRDVREGDDEDESFDV